MDYQKQLDIFLKKESILPKLVVIYGPTAAGKTSMSIDIAKKLDSEIISTDSRQIFKYMEIWTAKVTKDEMDGVRHHMVDFLDPNDEFSVWEYKHEAEKIMNNLYKKNKVPILVWWTWLYIDSLIYDFEIPEVLADWDLRKKLEQEAKDFWVDYVYRQLVDIDPEYAKELHPNNVQYVIRAIEVMKKSWISKWGAKKEKKLKYDVLFLTPYTGDREWLYNRINYRVDLMFEQWLEDEVKWLIGKWYNKNSFWMKSIWYEEYFMYLDWIYTFEEMINKIKQNTRNYAKRQLTWFRKYKN